MQENFTDTKVSLTLGGETYLISFGLHTMRRIEERQPGFTLMSEEVPFFNIVPFLIECAIPDEKRKWKTDEEFAEHYDNCKDEEALSKIPLAFQNAMGFTDRIFVPLWTRMQEAKQEMEKTLSEQEKKIKKPGKK